MTDPHIWQEKIAALQAFNLSPDHGIFPSRIIAHVLDIEIGTLNNLASAGSGPTFYKRGHARYYRKEDVVAWMLKDRKAA